MISPTIIYEDNHLLIVQKAPGYLSQADSSGRPDLLTWAAAYRNKPGRAFVGLVHRLDLAVGGVLALAKTSKAAARLSRQFRERSVDKIYLALVTGRPQSQAGCLEDKLCREASVTRLSQAAEKGSHAALKWSLLRSVEEYSFLEVKLLTGFKHQIRAQLGLRGFPVVGDFKYGSPIKPCGPAIGLWAQSLAFDHPTTGQRLTFQSSPLAVWPWSLVI